MTAISTFLSRIRDHYVDQFCRFADWQKSNCTKGASEVKLRLNEGSGLFENLYCVDFIKNDPPEVVELQPEHVLTFAPITGSFEDASLVIEYLRWDDVELHHDLNELSPALFSRWFDQWFDLRDARHDPNDKISHVIHSLLLRPGIVSVDFGTADTAAFLELLGVLNSAGARSIRVTSSKIEAPVSE